MARHMPITHLIPGSTTSPTAVAQGTGGARDQQRQADRSPSCTVQQRSWSGILRIVHIARRSSFYARATATVCKLRSNPIFRVAVRRPHRHWHSAGRLRTGSKTAALASSRLRPLRTAAPQERSARALLLLRSPLGCHPALSMAGPVSLTLRFLHFLAAERTRRYRRPMFKPRAQPRLTTLADPPDSSSGSQLSPSRSARQTEPIYVR